jgi:response regulator RpfG family c-di-GMP phosphodiesterase
MWMEQPRILIIEDDTSMLTSLTMIFRRKGYYVETAISGRSALENIKKNSYHLGLIDIKLPDMDGIDLIEPLKKINPEMVLIMVTGYASIESAVRALNAGASAYITKPINMDEVLAAIREALEKQRMSEEKKKADIALLISEERYRTIFNTSPVSIWEEDFSLVKEEIVQLQKQGIEDFNEYFYLHPEHLEEIINKIRILDVNQSTIKMFNARSKEDLLGSLEKIALPGTRDIIQKEVVAIAEEKDFFEGETINRTFDGEIIDLFISMTIPKEMAEFSNVLISMVDITERKKTENEIKARNEDIRLLYEAGIQLGASLKLDEVYKSVHKLISQVMGCDGLYISSYDKEKEIIKCEAAWGNDRELDISNFPYIPLGEEGKGTQSIVIHTGEPLYIPDFLEQKKTSNIMYFVNYKKTLLEDEPNGSDDIPKSALIVPLKLENQVIGVIQVFNYKKDAYQKGNMDFLKALSPQIAIALANAKLFEQSQLEIKRREEAESHKQKQLERLSAMHSIDLAISSSFDLKVTMDILLSQVHNHLDVDAATVLLLNPKTQRLEYIANKGFLRGLKITDSILLGQGFAGEAALEQKIVQVDDLKSSEPLLIRSALFKSEGFESYIGIPLIAKGQVVGVMEIFQRSMFSPEPDWLDYLKTLAGQAAIAIDNSLLFSNLQRANLELELAYDNTLEGWSTALELRDMETEGHSQRVTEWTVKLATEMGIPDEEIVQIKRGALLHDIGKMGVPDHILLKPGPLTDDEWDIMKMHPVYAYKLLSPIPFLQDALDIPYYHHERWDGSGYPKGLKEKEIPLAARIFAVVDVFDALSSDRPYRKAWKKEKIIEYIKKQSGVIFDPEVVDALLSMEENGGVN